MLDGDSQGMLESALRHEVYETQSQLQAAYIRIKELNEHVLKLQTQIEKLTHEPRTFSDEFFDK